MLAVCCPAVDPETAALIAQHHPDVVVFGHSHKAAHWEAGGVHYINSGAAGECRCLVHDHDGLVQVPCE